MIDWITLNDSAQINELINKSHTAAQVIFKHSTTCPISGIAKSRLESDWPFDIQPFYLDLLSYRSISDHITETFGVRHESPQILVVVDGQVIYHESHLDIASAAIEEALQKV